MGDPYANQTPNVMTPPLRHYAVTPDDDTDLPTIPKCLRIGGAGDIVVTDADGNDITYTVEAGELLIFRPTRVKATGTDATNIVAQY